MNPKVTVCVPIYKSASYIEQCVRSLFNQTLDEIEFLFLNDCTPDDSVEILKKVLEEYPTRINQVKIIENKQNKGHFEVFKTLFTNATGEYVISCDSDDWVEPDMYEKLYATAVRKKADMVLCDYWAEWPDKKEYKSVKFEGIKEELVRNALKGKYGFYSWISFVRREIYKKITYVDCGYIEDTPRFCQALVYSQRFAYVAEPLYHYRRQGQGITSQAKIDLIKRLEYICGNWLSDFFHQQYGDKFEYELLIKKLNAKSVWIFQYVPDEFYQLWPEANKTYLIKELHCSKNKKLLLWLAINHQRFLCDNLITIHKLFKPKK